MSDIKPFWANLCNLHAKFVKNLVKKLDFW